MEYVRPYRVVPADVALAVYAAGNLRTATLFGTRSPDLFGPLGPYLEMAVAAGSAFRVLAARLEGESAVLVLEASDRGQWLVARVPRATYRDLPYGEDASALLAEAAMTWLGGTLPVEFT